MIRGARRYNNVIRVAFLWTFIVNAPCVVSELFFVMTNTVFKRLITRIPHGITFRFFPVSLGQIVFVFSCVVVGIEIEKLTIFMNTLYYVYNCILNAVLNVY